VRFAKDILGSGQVQPLLAHPARTAASQRSCPAAVWAWRKFTGMPEWTFAGPFGPGHAGRADTQWNWMAVTRIRLF
jgi:hypothetical protein